MSQYKNTITGEVLIDSRVINDRFTNLSDNKLTKISFVKSHPSYESFNLNNTSRFNKKSLELNSNYTGSDNENIGLWLQTKNLSNDNWTVSCWVNYDKITSISTTFPQRILFDIGCLDNNNLRRTLLEIYNSVYFYNVDVSTWNTLQTINPYTFPSGWVHIAHVLNNKTISVYINGTKILGPSNLNLQFSNDKSSFIQLRLCIKGILLLDDIVVINNQALWTSNFTVPDYYLTGDHDLPNRLSNKNIIFPGVTDRNDYFDKAYLY